MIESHGNKLSGNDLKSKEHTMTYNILFLDIDGTILKPDHTYTASTKDAISQLQQQGIEIFLASGRHLHKINDLAEELKVHSLIGYNDACATCKDKKIV